MESTLEYQAKVYYKPSGRFSPAGPLSVWFFGGLTAALGGIIYAYALHYIPFVYLNWLFTIGFAFVLGIGAGIGVYFGHVRNMFVALLAGLIVGVFAEYLVWVVQFYAASGHETLETDPMGLLAKIQALAATGSWTMFGFKPTSYWLYSVWGMEAMVIIGLTALIARATASSPYCEDRGEWADEEEILGPLEPVADHAKLIEQLEHRNYVMLEDLRPVPEKTKKYTTLKINSCPSGGGLHVLTVQHVKMNKEGDVEEEEDIVSDLILLEADYHRLMNALSPELDEFESPAIEDPDADVPDSDAPDADAPDVDDKRDY